MLFWHLRFGTKFNPVFKVGLRLNRVAVKISLFLVISDFSHFRRALLHPGNSLSNNVSLTQLPWSLHRGMET
jgi:hypothetical protein